MFIYNWWELIEMVKADRLRFVICFLDLVGLDSA